VSAFAAPSGGATATLAGATATIGSNGVASVDATANDTAGTYRVTASAAGATAAASFKLTNTAVAPAAFTLGTFRPGTPTVPSAAQTPPTDPNGKTSGPTLAGTGTEFTALGLVNGQPVPRVIVSGAGWRSRRPWPAGAMRPRPAQQSTPG
jgi:hypothetical protein